jgi:hypothetical protein
MKPYLSSILVILASTLGSGLLTSGQASQRHIEKGVVEFNEPVKLLGVTLKGRYLFLHHDGLMQRGKPCTYVYALSDANPGRLILSFHCIPVPSERVAQLTFRFSGTSRGFDVPEILEIQFADSTESHKVT